MNITQKLSFKMVVENVENFRNAVNPQLYYCQSKNFIRSIFYDALKYRRSIKDGMCYKDAKSIIHEGKYK